MTPRSIVCALALLSSPAMADVPNVSADILPVHSLVARVMGEVGTPDLILPPGASPHGYAMRPSQAAALEQAGIVFWVGPGLTPWLAESIETLAADATIVTLLEQEGVHLRAFDEPDEHDDHEDDHDDAEHDDHADHDDHDDHSDHAHHDHGDVDPHAWLDPVNGQVWLAVIADALSAADPDNAALYQANAKAGQAELEALTATMTDLIAPLRATEFAVYHDAFGYLETRFGVTPHLSLLDFEADKPGAQRIASMREEVRKHGITHILTEPQADLRLIDTVFEDTEVTICEIDHLGTEFAAGPSNYWQSLETLASKMNACVGPE